MSSFHLDVAAQKTKSSCHHSKEVYEVIVITLIFNTAAMEKSYPPCPFAVTGEEEEEEEINLMAWRDTNPMDLIL